jgi:hypothetical protein
MAKHLWTGWVPRGESAPGTGRFIISTARTGRTKRAATLTSALRVAAGYARTSGGPILDGGASVTTGSAHLATCTFRAQAFTKRTQRYDPHRVAVCKLTAAGRKVLTAEKRRRRARQ